MYIKNIISLVLCGVIILVSLPYVHGDPQNLSAKSMFAVGDNSGKSSSGEDVFDSNDVSGGGSHATGIVKGLERYLKYLFSVIIVGLLTVQILPGCFLEEYGLGGDSSIDGDSDVDVDVDTDVDSDSDIDIDGDADVDGDADDDSEIDIDSDVDVGADGDMDGEPDADGDADIDSDMDEDSGAVIPDERFNGGIWEFNGGAEENSDFVDGRNWTSHGADIFSDPDCVRFNSEHATYLSMSPEVQGDLDLSGNLTIAAWIDVPWVSMPDGTRTMMVFSRVAYNESSSGGDVRYNDIAFYVRAATGRLASYAWNPVIGDQIVESRSALTAGRHHVVITREILGGDMVRVSFYIDGELDSEQTQIMPSGSSSPGIPAGSRPWLFAGFNGSSGDDRRYSDGDIGGLRLATGDGAVLNADEVRALYSSTRFRSRYATDWQDSDLKKADDIFVKSQLDEGRVQVETDKADLNIRFVTKWDGVLRQDGLGFTINGRDYSALTVKTTKGNNEIYMPLPDILISLLKIEGIAVEKIKAVVQKRQEIIIKHEKDELSQVSHKEAVLNEYIGSNNGLNYADVVTILLEVLVSGKFKELNDKFHTQFIIALLSRYMPLSARVYGDMLKDMLGVQDGGGIFDNIMPAIRQLAMPELEKLIETYWNGEDESKIIYTRGINDELNQAVISAEPGYSEFIKAKSTKLEGGGTILIDLERFFIENDSLSTVRMIDVEYYKRFTHFVKNLDKNITIIGVTSMPENDIGVAQLAGQLKQHLSRVYYNVNFADYSNLFGKGEGKVFADRSVSILSKESAGKIKNSGELKIVAPYLEGYNHVSTVWQEFSVAVDGIEKQKEEFVNMIVEIAAGLLNELVKRGQLQKDKADEIIKGIKIKGIGYIPVYFDPIGYYRSIENMRQILTYA
jgi:hypothetical protein